MIGRQVMDENKVPDSFVARVWLEKGPGESVVLRGHIRQIKSTQETHFQGLEEMAEFIAKTSGAEINQEKRDKTHDND